MDQCVNWIFGRGVSIGCNLTWKVPDLLNEMPRDKKIAEIKKAILKEMQSEKINTHSIKIFLKNLAEKTSDEWCHRLITTNWDCLIEKEIKALNLDFLPKWLIDSYVYHLNGTVEVHENLNFGSPFLLEEDSYLQRANTVETDQLFNSMLWGNIFFVVGMSFECETDRFLLHSLNQVQDDVPIGESIWFVLNPDPEALEVSSSRIARALPRAKVYTRCISFGDWVNEENNIMVKLGVFRF
jgi:hypothetical protein